MIIVVSHQESFDCSNLGENMVTLTVTDTAGLTNTCMAIVTVVDVTAPEAICQNITVELDDDGLAVITAADINNGSNDNCSITSMSVSQESFDCSNLGENMVTLTVTDAAGLTDTCMAIVTVVDVTAPEAICQNITVELDDDGLAVITAADINNGSNDNCSIASMSVSQESFDCSNLGENMVTLTVTDTAGLTNTCMAIVTVVDVTAPEAICQNITVELDDDGLAVITAADINNGSNDNCSIASMSVSQESFDCSNLGENMVTLTVTDAAGLTDTCMAIVTVVDVTAPEAICQNITIELDDDGLAVITADDVNNGSNDNCSIASMSVSQESFDCSNLGENMVTLTVTDAAGLTNTCMAIVTVEDPIVPVIDCPEDQIVGVDEAGSGFYTLPDYIALGEVTTDDNCPDSVTVTQTPVSGTELPDGIHTITLTATDAQGNEVECSFELTVDETLGVTDTELQRIHLYPNPTSGMVNIISPSLAIDQITIFDIHGRTVKQFSSHGIQDRYQFDLSALTSAIYFVQISTPKGVLIRRISKK